MSTDNPVVTSGEQDSTSTSEIDVLNEGAEETTEETPGEETPEAEPESEVSQEVEEPAEEPEVPAEQPKDEIEEEEIPLEEPTRLSWQLIKEKYPELTKNKDFRELYFRDKAFTEVFPTVADAKDAATKAEQLDLLDQTLVEGEVDTIFSTINDDVLRNISTKILPALYKVNKQYFANATRPIIVDVMHGVLEQAQRTGDKNLEISVRNISRALTGKPDLPSRTPPTVDPAVEEERNKLRQARESLFRGQERNFLTAADKMVSKRIEALVVDGLDPKKELNEFSRNAVKEKTIADIERIMRTDENYKVKMRQLHRLATRSNFPDEYKARMVAASLERVKKLIPVLRNKHRTAALGKQSTKSETPSSKKIVSTNEKVTTGPSRITSARQIDMRRTSEEDFLNDKITFKK